MLPLTKWLRINAVAPPNQSAPITTGNLSSLTAGPSEDLILRKCGTMVATPLIAHTVLSSKMLQARQSPVCPFNWHVSLWSAASDEQLAEPHTFSGSGECSATQGTPLRFQVLGAPKDL